MRTVRLLPFVMPLATITILAFWAGLSTGVLAGGGPENVLVVVNPQSPASVVIADCYVRLRQVPEGNVFRLAWDPKQQTTDVETFRQKILGPILTEIEARGLREQIDCVAYSSDFPWGIDVKPDPETTSKETEKAQAPSSKPAEPKGPQAGKDAPASSPPKPGSRRHRSAVGPTTCSLNGLTYLYQPVMEGNFGGYLNMQSNQYLRGVAPAEKRTATRAFRSTLHFGAAGELVESGGRSYLLCTVLDVTAGRGNSVAEVLNYLERAAKADGTHPKGTIYYCQNGDIRSRIRQGAFLESVDELKRLGVAALLLGQPDLLGRLVAARLHLLHARLGGAAAGVEVQHHGGHGLQPPAAQAAVKGFGIIADGAQVVHGELGIAETGCRL